MDVDQAINGFMDEATSGDLLSYAILGVSLLIGVLAIFALVISIYLAIRYVKYNRKENSMGLTGEWVARKFLDMYDLKNITVTCSGSVMFGNSYSHYFKKVRLRRMTWKKKSVASMAMAAQKSCLAILDKEGDPDMKRRVKMTPLVTFGPLAFIPLVIIGAVLDYAIMHTQGVFTIALSIVGLIFYVFTFILNLNILKTEKKAQDKALLLVAEKNLATESEIKDMKKLFKLYNIEYVNNLIISLLEIILYVLRIVQMARGGGAGTPKSD